MALPQKPRAAVAVHPTRPHLSTSLPTTSRETRPHYDVATAFVSVSASKREMNAAMPPHARRVDSIADNDFRHGDLFLATRTTTGAVHAIILPIYQTSPLIGPKTAASTRRHPEKTTRAGKNLGDDPAAPLQLGETPRKCEASCAARALCGDEHNNATASPFNASLD